eukprot:CAMPEP_0172747272 /NCGR_PEP_ID=MMETSP1074-20121228/142396_1 /TAXON_ID=2916 /ORGANISM="Ceratium fusus, Strain PA161109" /LENGTH=156 /DNA_ID=CAMNT_0013578763 /DNA_START=377 /DNA_END=844 /DNA_ORIENTATION=-
MPMVVSSGSVCIRISDSATTPCLLERGVRSWPCADGAPSHPEFSSPEIPVDQALVGAALRGDREAAARSGDLTSLLLHRGVAFLGSALRGDREAAATSLLLGRGVAFLAQHEAHHDRWSVPVPSLLLWRQNTVAGYQHLAMDCCGGTMKQTQVGTA